MNNRFIDDLISTFIRNYLSGISAISYINGSDYKDLFTFVQANLIILDTEVAVGRAFAVKYIIALAFLGLAVKLNRLKVLYLVAVVFPDLLCGLKQRFCIYLLAGKLYI